MSFTTADAMRFVQSIVVAVLDQACQVSLNVGQNVKLAPTVCHALSFSSDAIRTVSENVYAHVVGTAVNAHHSLSSV